MGIARGVVCEVLLFFVSIYGAKCGGAKFCETDSLFWNRWPALLFIVALTGSSR